MAYGLQVFNDGGYLQIDQDFSNFALRYTGALNALTWTAVPEAGPLNPGVPVMNMSVASVTLTCDTPLVAIDPSAGGGMCAFWMFTKSGSAYTFYFYCNTTNIATTGCRYMIFDQPPPISGGFGLAVYKADGSLAFHSDYTYMRVADVVSPSTTSTPVAVPSGRKYAIAKPRPPLIVEENIDTFFPIGDSRRNLTGQYTGGFATQSGSTITVSDRVLTTNQRSVGLGRGVIYSTGPTPILVLDITNF